MLFEFPLWHQQNAVTTITKSQAFVQRRTLKKKWHFIKELTYLDFLRQHTTVRVRPHARAQQCNKF